MLVEQPVAPRAPAVFRPWPSYDDEEVAAALDVLRSGRVNYWTGEEGARFEEEFARYVGVRHAVAVANGTVALELALASVGVGEGDEVVVPSRTFIGTASAVVACGALPVVCDVDRDSGNLTPDTVLEALTPRTKAVIAVHLAGWPCDMPALVRLAAERDLLLIEDCAQAHGAELGCRRAGSFGDAAAFSFCQDKILSTGGEGGMVLTGDDGVWRRVWERKDHGRSLDAAASARDPGVGYKRIYDSFGTNARMTEMQAAIGRAQLRKLDAWLDVRRANAAVLDERLAEVPGLRLAVPPAAVRHAYYKYYAYVEADTLKSSWSRDRIVAEVSDAGVPCFTGICPEIYRERAFVDAGLAPARRLPVARELGDASIVLLVHPGLSEEHMYRAGDVVGAVMREGTR